MVKICGSQNDLRKHQCIVYLLIFSTLSLTIAQLLRTPPMGSKKPAIAASSSLPMCGPKTSARGDRAWCIAKSWPSWGHPSCNRDSSSNIRSWPLHVVRTMAEHMSLNLKPYAGLPVICKIGPNRPPISDIKRPPTIPFDALLVSVALRSSRVILERGS